MNREKISRFYPFNQSGNLTASVSDLSLNDWYTARMEKIQLCVFSFGNVGLWTVTKSKMLVHGDKGSTAQLGGCHA